MVVIMDKQIYLPTRNMQNTMNFNYFLYTVEKELLNNSPIYMPQGVFLLRQNQT